MPPRGIRWDFAKKIRKEKPGKLALAEREISSIMKIEQGGLFMEKEEVRKSVEVRFYRFNTLLFLILYLVIVAMFVAITFGVGLPLPGALHFVLAMVGIATVVFLPFMIFYLIRWVGPIIHAQDYVKQEVAFGISGPLINGMNYFPLTLTIDGVQTSKDTHGVQKSNIPRKSLLKERARHQSP